MSGRLNRVRVWPRVPAACGSRTRGSNRRASGPPLSRRLRYVPDVFPVLWFVLASANMWVGVSHVGYSL